MLGSPTKHSIPKGNIVKKPHSPTQHQPNSPSNKPKKQQTVKRYDSNIEEDKNLAAGSITKEDLHLVFQEWESQLSAMRLVEETRLLPSSHSAAILKDIGETGWNLILG